VDDAVRARLGAGAAETVRAAEAGAPAAEESARASADEAAELADEQQALAERVGTARAAVVARREWEERDRYHREKAAEVQRAVREAEGELLDLEDAASAADARLAELQAVERVLGLRGVRSHVIAGALGGLEAVANAWLDRLMPGGAISLRSDSETARGGTVERIALDIHGLGHDHGYKGCSGGERRRVDVAMVLALAEVHAAAAGTGQGTMWFDEVFDTLDPAGIAGVSEALSEIAEDRCVVVITHSDDVASELDAAQRFVFANGVAS
jgi:exonuclease SbcC